LANKLLIMIHSISLIIPHHNDELNLLRLLQNIPKWNAIPGEIIIIDSSDKEVFIPEDLYLFFANSGIRFLVLHQKKLFPGHARNIGISEANNTILAFLDSSTHPSNDWLLKGLNTLEKEGSDGVWGRTSFEANTFTARIIRACTYGNNPLKTFPGSILHKSTFNKCGLFIQSTRAGEDGDWMARAELQGLNISSATEVLAYDKLDKMSILKLLNKWFRNYSYSSQLPHRQLQKDYYYLGLSVFAVFFAYNWNRVLAAWDTTSIFYIPNITKISFLIIISAYVLIRVFILPLKKGVKLRFLLPVNFMFIFFISLLIDSTKILAFIYSRFNKIFNG